jgi:6-pyruvoyltetrahydropterin/6-carboxytetrahydropterin synthase
MFRLSREVRFAINAPGDEQLATPPTNSFAGYPSLTGLGHYFSLEATVLGQPDAQSGCIVNIKDIDQAIRRRAIPVTADFIRSGRQNPAELLARIYNTLQDAWPGHELDNLRLRLTPFLSFQIFAKEHPMVRLSQRFEFSASHRLHNPELTDQENQRLFGKCNNPHGHGHNYVVEVTVAGSPSDSKPLSLPALERIVSDTVVEPFDHKNLNQEISQFRTLIPSVENIAMVIYRLLQSPLKTAGTKLAAVTVWETSKTWCEYSE